MVSEAGPSSPGDRMEAWLPYEKAEGTMCLLIIYSWKHYCVEKLPSNSVCVYL